MYAGTWELVCRQRTSVLVDCLVSALAKGLICSIRTISYFTFLD